jgi:hypothetical protein
MSLLLSPNTRGDAVVKQWLCTARGDAAREHEKIEENAALGVEPESARQP